MKHTSLSLEASRCWCPDLHKSFGAYAVLGKVIDAWRIPSVECASVALRASYGKRYLFRHAAASAVPRSDTSIETFAG